MDRNIEAARKIEADLFGSGWKSDRLNIEKISTILRDMGAFPEPAQDALVVVEQIHLLCADKVLVRKAEVATLIEAYTRKRIEEAADRADVWLDAQTSGSGVEDNPAFARLRQTQHFRLRAAITGKEGTI